jgi:hypothetical protein
MLALVDFRARLQHGGAVLGLSLQKLHTSCQVGINTQDLHSYCHADTAELSFINVDYGKSRNLSNAIHVSDYVKPMS